MKYKIYSLLVLLLMGSTSIMAEGDPFSDYNPKQFSNNMILVGRVYLDGQILGEKAVVAVYCGNVLRGKQSPDNDGVLYLSIGGEYSGDKLHFKVFTGGRVIEVDQNLTYTNNDIIGSIDEPYAINLPSPVITTPLTEGWATTCLPFDAEVPEGVTVWNVTAIENQELVKNEITTGTILPANTPVLLKSNGLTNYEWLSRVAYDESSIITIDSSLLRGTTETLTVAANSVLTLGYSNEGYHRPGFWRFTGTTVDANSAYIADFPADSNGVPFSLDVTTPISEKEKVNSNKFATAVYDLQGRRIGENGKLKKTNGAVRYMKKNSQGQIIIIK